MTVLDRQQAVVTATIAALAGDARLASLIGGRVYDAPPPRAALPSIALRVVSALDASSADTDAQRLSVDVDVYDRYALGANLNGPRIIMGHIRRILHMQPLSSAGVSILSVRCVASQGPVRDPDDIALHGTVSVSVLCGHETSPF